MREQSRRPGGLPRLVRLDRLLLGVRHARVRVNADPKPRNRLRGIGCDVKLMCPRSPYDWRDGQDHGPRLHSTRTETRSGLRFRRLPPTRIVLIQPLPQRIPIAGGFFPLALEVLNLALRRSPDEAGGIS